MLSFAAGEVSVEMQLTETRPGVYSLLAFVSGVPAGSEVKVEHSAGFVAAELDDAGRLPARRRARGSAPAAFDGRRRYRGHHELGSAA